VIASTLSQEEEGVVELPTTCFLCAEDLNFPYVLWAGGGLPLTKDSSVACPAFERLRLHPECAVQLGVRLIHDGFHVRVISKVGG
jgi:hypothetical protein